ncbi:tryptophanyl-tRNA synthetase [Fusarium beomiforme]|uniref:Small ribosomal subunit protein uS10m n=1 Tax=Fusarium beomiforme TaxID=44412 RepID=A0A9P5ACM0_9HYPO|nr:tryptophanyl-tRNA synthetase [Fusarium beomiforme]
MMRQSIRPLRALSSEVSWIARRTQASLAKPGDLIPNKAEESQQEAGPEPRFPRSIQALHLKPLKREAEHGIPSCDLQLRSYSVQPLEFFSDFALRAAYYLGLPAYGPVPLPRITERWTVPRDNFIFKKAQENFERKTLRRLIQIRDGNPETVQLWLAYLRKHQFYGVGMKANMWEFSELGVGKKMDALPESEKGEIDAKWEHLGQTKTIGTVEKVEELLNQRRFREAAGLKVPPTTSVSGSSSALRQWVQLQNENPEDKLIYSIVDLHAITTPQKADVLSKNKKEALAALLAIGIDPERPLMETVKVPAHSELMWILSCTASVGYLSRMTQWKSKLNICETDRMTDKSASNLKLGLFSYPVLQAADILVHRATHVPVGEDQRQHLEFARECVTNFNAAYGDHLVSPQTTNSNFPKIMSLNKPQQKMSKSDLSINSRISFTDSPAAVKAKIKRAVTDSIPGISYDIKERPGVSNLLNILAVFDVEGRKAEELAEQYSDLSLQQLKDMVSDAVVGGLEPFQKRYAELMEKGDKYLDSIEAIGAEKARQSAEETMQIVRQAVGL